MKRRSLLGAMLAACSAPAFVKASSLMPLYIPAPRKVWTPDHRLIPLGEGELRLYDGDGNVLASMGIGSMVGGQYSGAAYCLRTGTAKKARFTIPGVGQALLDAGSLGSGAGFTMNTTNMLSGGWTVVSGSLQY